MLSNPLTVSSIKRWYCEGALCSSSPLKLSQILNCKSGEFLAFRCKRKLPKTTGQVERGKNCTARPSNVANAFFDRFHRVFVCVGVRVKFSKIKNIARRTVFLRYHKDRRIVRRVSRLDNPHFKPFFDLKI